MCADTPEDITGLLRAWTAGDHQALERLIPVVEPELRRIAHQRLNQSHGRTGSSLNTTALVNEACLHLLAGHELTSLDRLHFFALCARIMRAILVDHARARHSAKRGAGEHPLPLLEDKVPAPEPDTGLLAIDEALDALVRIDARKGRVVELRFFGGLTVDETAEVLGISPNTVKRDWQLAKLWLLREMSANSPLKPDPPASSRNRHKGHLTGPS